MPAKGTRNDGRLPSCKRPVRSEAIANLQADTPCIAALHVRDGRGGRPERGLGVAQGGIGHGSRHLHPILRVDRCQGDALAPIGGRERRNLIIPRLFKAETHGTRPALVEGMTKAKRIGRGIV